MNENDTDKPERRTSQKDIANEVKENRSSIEELQKDVDELKEILKPVAEFYSLMRSDIDTLGRFGRALRSFLAWGAACIIAAGVLIAWFKNGMKFPGVD